MKLSKILDQVVVVQQGTEWKVINPRDGHTVASYRDSIHAKRHADMINTLATENPSATRKRQVKRNDLKKHQ